MLFVLSLRGAGLAVAGFVRTGPGDFVVIGKPPATLADTARLGDDAGLLVEPANLLGGRFVMISFPGADLELVIRLRLALDKPAVDRAGDAPEALVDGFLATAAAGAPAGRPGADDPMMALEGAPPGRLIVGEPMMPPEGEPPGRAVVRDPVMALEGAPPGRLVVRDPTMPLEGVPPGRPVVRDPIMAVEGVPPGRPFVGDPILALEGAPAGRPFVGDPMMALEETPAGGCALTEPPGKELVWARRPVAGAAIKTKAARRISPICAGYNLALKNGFVLYIKEI